MLYLIHKNDRNIFSLDWLVTPCSHQGQKSGKLVTRPRRKLNAAESPLASYT